MKPLLLVIALAALLAPRLPQAQTRDVQRFEVGAAVLSGIVVVDEPNGPPVRRAIISIVLNNDSRQQFQTSTDDRGRFIVAGLAAGNARLIASRPGYVTTYYGARQPGSNIGVPIALTNGQTADVTVRLPRGAVIAGIVKDENGQPMPGVGVRAQRVSVSASGQRTFAATSGALIPSTDDRGAFRMFGLPAGDYVVSAQPRLTAGAEVRPTSQAELQWAERQIQGGRAGGAGGAPESAAPPALTQSVTYASVFYPGTASVAQAGVITLGPGQERSGVDLRMQFVPTARIEGVVTNPNGQPAVGMQITLIPKGESVEQDSARLDAARLAVMMELGLLSGGVARSDASGSFSLAGIEPGAYIVMARTPVTGRAGGPAPAGGLWATTDVDVNGRDITGLSLRLAPGQTVAGRVVFTGSRPFAAPARGSISLRAVDATGFSSTATVSAPSVNEAFEVPGMIPASYRVSAAITGWTLMSAVLAGRDVTDVPLTIKPGQDLSDLLLTFTDSAPEVSGTLYDGAGRPTSDLSIVLISVDRAMWFAGSRRVRPAVRPASDGRFTFTGLAPGEYYMAALTDVAPADLVNPQFLEQIIPAAIKVVVAAGEKKVQDLRIAR